VNDQTAPTEHPARFQIRALDGGVKALFTAHLLARLEDDLGVRIRDSFDLISPRRVGVVVELVDREHTQRPARGQRQPPRRRARRHDVLEPRPDQFLEPVGGQRQRVAPVQPRPRALLPAAPGPVACPLAHRALRAA